MKLSQLQGEKRARMICRLAEPLAALSKELDEKEHLDGAAWTALALERNEAVLQVVGMLSERSALALGGMRNSRLRRILRRTLDGELLALLALIRQAGAEAVMAAVCQCGAPPTIRALAAWLAQMDRQLGWRHYMAELLWLTAQSLRGGEIPRYSVLLQAGEAFDASGQALPQGLAAALRRKGVNRHQAL